MGQNNPITIVRELKNITRRELARKTGIPYATLSNIETGCPGHIHAKTAVKIAEFSQQKPSEIQRSYDKWRESLKDAA